MQGNVSGVEQGSRVLPNLQMARRSPLEMTSLFNFKIVTQGLTSVEWKSRMDFWKYKGTVAFKEALDNPDPHYDDVHVCQPDKKFLLSFVRINEFILFHNRSTKEVKEFLVKYFGYQVLDAFTAEFVFLIRENFSNKEFDELGIKNLVVPHKMIVNQEGKNVPYLLGITTQNGDTCFVTHSGDPNYLWPDSTDIYMPVILQAGL